MPHYRAEAATGTLRELRHSGTHPDAHIRIAPAVQLMPCGTCGQW